jgi:uncharacterized protein DUF2510
VGNVEGEFFESRAQHTWMDRVDNTLDRAEAWIDRIGHKSPSPPSGSPPAGWYPDPSGAPGLRYFDGNDWTPHWSSELSAETRGNSLDVVPGHEVATGSMLANKLQVGDGIGSPVRGAARALFCARRYQSSHVPYAAA